MTQSWARKPSCWLRVALCFSQLRSRFRSLIALKLVTRNDGNTYSIELSYSQIGILKCQWVNLLGMRLALVGIEDIYFINSHYFPRFSWEIFHLTRLFLGVIGWLEEFIMYLLACLFLVSNYGRHFKLALDLWEIDIDNIADTKDASRAWMQGREVAFIEDLVWRRIWKSRKILCPPLWLMTLCKPNICKQSSVAFFM